MEKTVVPNYLIDKQLFYTAIPEGADFICHVCGNYIRNHMIVIQDNGNGADVGHPQCVLDEMQLLMLKEEIWNM